MGFPEGNRSTVVQRAFVTEFSQHSAQAPYSVAPWRDQQRIRDLKRIRRVRCGGQVRNLDFIAKVTGITGEFSHWWLRVEGRERREA